MPIIEGTRVSFGTWPYTSVLVTTTVTRVSEEFVPVRRAMWFLSKRMIEIVDTHESAFTGTAAQRDASFGRTFTVANEPVHVSVTLAISIPQQEAKWIFKSIWRRLKKELRNREAPDEDVLYLVQPVARSA